MKENKLSYENEKMDTAFETKFMKDFQSNVAKTKQLQEEIRVTLGKRKFVQRVRNQENDAEVEELSCTYSGYNEKVKELK